MLRKTVVILTMLFCSMATQLYALGLGAVTVESSLNQPLKMRIELLQLGDTRLQDIKVSMASGADFERFNIERDSFLSNVRFSVESSAQGAVVVLTTAQIVREPYLSFILDTRWPNGRLLSEHTVLLDLPIFADQQAATEIRQPISPVLQAPTSAQVAEAEPFVESSAASVSAPTSSRSAANLQPEVITPDSEPEVADIELIEQAQEKEELEEPPVEPETETAIAAAAEEELTEDVAAEEVAEEVEEELVAEEVADDIVAEAAEEELDAETEAIDATAELVAPEVNAEPETIETDGSDTLSDIALQVRPNPSVTMQQTMLAIQELNPDAFSDGNINRLRSGQVLRVPSLEQVQSVDPRYAIDEVTRQNQEFAEAGVQPLAPPPDATPDSDEQPQGQLSVVSSDDALDGSGGTGSGDAGDEAIDQRVAELEAQLAQRQEEVDRARVEREELASRMADLEEQIAAAQEIIRLQDIQLAQLQDSLAAAAAEAQLAAEQQAAALTEASQPIDSSSSFADDVMRILTGNSLFMIFAVVLVILLLVVLMLRRNRASKEEEHDIDELAEQDFDADAENVTAVDEHAEAEEVSDEDADASAESSVEEEAATEFQDYDSSDLDDELDDIDDIIGEGDEAASGDEADGVNEEPQLNVITLVEQLIGEQQYRRALSMLNTSLQEQGENAEVRAKIAEVEELLEAEGVEQLDTDTAVDAEDRESETKSFLDDLGIDLDSFDYEDEASDSQVEPSEAEPADSVEAEEVSAESEDVDMMFDLGGDDVGESPTDEPAADEPEPEPEPETEAEEAEAFEFDLDDDSNAVESNAKDPEDIEIDTLEFDADAGASVTEPVEESAESVENAEDPNALDFSFDKDELSDDTEVPAPASNEEVETFDFDLEEGAGDTILEKPNTEIDSASEDDAEDFDFDLDEFEVEPGKEEAATSDADADDDFLDLDAEASQDENVEIDVDEVEFDIDSAPEENETVSDASEGDLTDDDDLEFLSDGDVELESVEVEEVEEDDVLSDDDETATKLELAYAYQKMGDTEGAKEILQEVIKEGTDEQIEEANNLLGSLDAKSD